MSLARAVSTSLGYCSCRGAIARSFVVLPIQGHGIAAQDSWTASTPYRCERTFTSTPTRRDENTAPNVTSEPSSPPSQEPPVPWYLQPQHARVRTAIETEEPPRDLIPDLPPNPPPLLQTLLEHISINLGLDDLALLDLRHIDPPPALGSKLIMILGTARSEKHLHVSADRFCRYLRREHNLRAHAAGLLGRNELKIKLRRKAKRMRMLANVGAQESEGAIDDGIRTGWICCTIGKIEAHPEDQSIPGLETEDDGFVGFREVSTGVNVVVQMFTEEKRGEINLDNLWGGVMRTHERGIKKADEELGLVDGESVAEVEVEVEEVEEGAGEQKTEAQEAAAPAKIQFEKPSIARRPSDPFPETSAARPKRQKDFFPSTSGPDTAHQVRRLHTVGLRS